MAHRTPRGMEVDARKERAGHDMYEESRRMVTGIVLVLEDISDAKRMMSTLSRYMVRTD
eukprot:SAG31_NODE_3728_length_3948_cov_1.597504_3_plen_59_part_00